MRVLPRFLGPYYIYSAPKVLYTTHLVRLELRPSEHLCRDDGIRTHAMFKVVHKTRFLTRVSSLFSASANLTPGFLLQDIFHHDTRFIALCPSSELHPYISTPTRTRTLIAGLRVRCIIPSAIRALEQCTRFELAPESWQDPMQPLTPTLH